MQPRCDARPVGGSSGDCSSGGGGSDGGSDGGAEPQVARPGFAEPQVVDCRQLPNRRLGVCRSSSRRLRVHRVVEPKVECPSGCRAEGCRSIQALMDAHASVRTGHRPVACGSALSHVAVNVDVAVRRVRRRGTVPGGPRRWADVVLRALPPADSSATSLWPTAADDGSSVVDSRSPTDRPTDRPAADRPTGRRPTTDQPTDQPTQLTPTQEYVWFMVLCTSVSSHYHRAKPGAH